MIAARNVTILVALWIFIGVAIYNTVGTQDWVAITAGALTLPIVLALVLCALFGDPIAGRS